MTDALHSRLSEIQRACEALASEIHGELTERQRARVAEIHACVGDLTNTLSLYEVASAVPEMSHGDPRARLVYAARTPLAMIEMATRLLTVAHLRQGETLTYQQQKLVMAIEAAAHKMIEETEGLWRSAQVKKEEA
jgi:hypothetical protein